MIPDYLLVHEITVVRPSVVTDSYGNDIYDYDGSGAVEFAMKAWIQQDLRNQLNQDSAAKQGRFAADERWLMITNDDDVRWQDRILALERTFVVYAQPEPTYSMNGYHHMESTLQIVQD